MPKGVYVRTAEYRAKLSSAGRGNQRARGHVLSDEARARISEALIGRSVGPLSGTWRGDDVGYEGIHRRARMELPRECAHCGTTERVLHCALIHGRGVRRSPTEGWYSNRVEDYVRLCVPCHARYDKGAA